MAQRRHTLAALAATGLLPWALPACGTTPSLPPLKALTAADFLGAGQRGVGFGLLAFGNRADADHDALRALGAGHVRMFIDARRAGAEESYRFDDAQLQALDAVLDSLQARGLRLVLVASFGPDARDALWKSSRLQASAVQGWRTLAQRVRGRAAVAGFDLVNEPVPPGLTFAARQDRWLDFVARLIEAVRAVDPTRVLIVESAPDATGASFENMRPLPFDNVVYSAHSYAPYDFTHQAVAAEHRELRRYPERMADGRPSSVLLAESLAPVQRFASRHRVPIYVGEFSAPRWAPDGSAARYVADSIAAFHGFGWSWAYHEYRAWHGWDPEIADGGTEARRRTIDAPVLRALRDGLRGPRG